MPVCFDTATRFATVRGDQVEIRRVLWVWPGRIPRGKVTLIAGDPGLGKSFLMLDIAARLSRGDPMPGETSTLPPCDTLFLSAEDDPHDTLVTRAIAMSARLERLHFARFVVSGAEEAYEGEISLDRHFHALERTVEMNPWIRLVVIDPISAYLGTIGENRNAEVRDLLARLSRIAEARNLAIVCVGHLNKARGERALYRAMGSLAFVAAARTVHLVCRHPDNPEQRLFIHAKSNLCRPAPTLSYRFELPFADPEDPAHPTDEARAAMGENDAYLLDIPAIVWDTTPVGIDAESFDSREEVDEADTLDEACAWLTDALSQGPLAANEIRERADRDGVAFGTLRRAKRRLGVVSRKTSDTNSPWVWAFPAPAPAPGAAQQ